MAQLIEGATFSHLLLGLIFFGGLAAINKWARLPEDFWEKEKARQALQIKPGSLKILP